MSWFSGEKEKEARAKAREESRKADEERCKREEAEERAKRALAKLDNERLERQRIEKEVYEERQEKEKAKQEAREATEKAEEELKQKKIAQWEAKNAKRQAEAEKVEVMKIRQLADNVQETAEAARREAQQALEETKRAKELAESEKQAKQEALEKANEEKEKALEAQNKVEIERIEKERVLKKAEEERKKQLEKERRLQSEKDAFHRENEEHRRKEEERERTEEEMKNLGWGTMTELKWSTEEASRIRELIVKDRVDKEGNDISMKILVFGPTGHGKSSFCNGCRSAIKETNQPSTYYPVANIGVSLTRGFHSAPYGKTWIIDMGGIYESKTIHSVNIADIASGQVPFYAQLTETLEVKDKQSIDIPDPGDNDVSCVVIVLKYDTELSPELRRQIETIMQLGGEGVLSYHLVLTSLDQCDPQFNNTDNIKNIFHSAKVQEAVKRMSEETGIPPFAISFVKNYVKEVETDINLTHLHLKALERIMSSGLEQVEKRIDQKIQIESYALAKKKKHARHTSNIPIMFDKKIAVFVLLVAVIFMLLCGLFGGSANSQSKNAIDLM